MNIAGISSKALKPDHAETLTNNDARELKLSLNFLTPGKKYEASIYYDDPNSTVRTKVSIKRIKVYASTVLDTKLIASGGQSG
jgi:alpha-glucosidase